MNITLNSKRLLASGMMLSLLTLASSCKKNVTADTQIVDEDTSPRAIYSSRSVSFDRADGTYTLSQANGDFGNISGTWKEANASIYSNQARIRIPANTLSNGNIVNIDVSDGSEYELTFKVRFGPNFQWSRGGKVGFGFAIGNGFTGCNPAWDGTGGTARLMWYNPTNQKDNSGTDNPYFRPYVYYRDMPQSCGDSFGKQSVRLNKDQWYTVRIRVKSNNGSSSDGSGLYQVDGVTLLSTSLRWTTNDTYRKIREITFHTFRGGSDTYWQSTSDGLIYYNDLSWTRIAS
ncbi:polysaccharide lyase [Desertivirga brevis]|uniref:polysaccharide lyase n=1 Tax=Desertivirga brevis TaxID=2810310 RepID=UPI001A97C3EF|nr:hypothetical protein [Pedobacter sp. SYSU D00873]